MATQILIVDDNPVNLKLACDVMEDAGFAVHRAIDAEQAQVLLEHIMPDLILMDLGLPGMSGLSLTRILKANDRLKHVPVVALTAFAMKGDEFKAIDAGCRGYIAKPIDTRQLATQVLSFLGPEYQPSAATEGARKRT